MLKLVLLTLAATACAAVLAAPLPAPSGYPAFDNWAEDLCSRDGTCSHVPPEPPKKP